MRIFAIDDEKSALRVLHNAIAQAAPQAEIVDFSLGVDALAAMEDGQACPDVVFTDIRMPRLDGLALAARIRAVSQRTKVVFVTAYSDYAYEAIQLRASGYVMKPVTAESIKAHIREAIAMVDGKGIIIGPGCVADPRAPEACLKALREAVEHD